MVEGCGIWANVAAATVNVEMAAKKVRRISSGTPLKRRCSRLGAAACQTSTSTLGPPPNLGPGTLSRHCHERKIFVNKGGLLLFVTALI
jgi:hypothetical protein